jgi:PIN domain nuclease of toxin-antitoxin system
MVLDADACRQDAMLMICRAEEIGRSLTGGDRAILAMALALSARRLDADAALWRLSALRDQ